jgi:hypothetical protein
MVTSVRIIYTKSRGKYLQRPEVNVSVVHAFDAGTTFLDLESKQFFADALKDASSGVTAWSTDDGSQSEDSAGVFERHGDSDLDGLRTDGRNACSDNS